MDTNTVHARAPGMAEVSLTGEMYLQEGDVISFHSTSPDDTFSIIAYESGPSSFNALTNSYGHATNYVYVTKTGERVMFAGPTTEYEGDPDPSQGLSAADMLGLVYVGLLIGVAVCVVCLFIDEEWPKVKKYIRRKTTTKPPLKDPSKRRS